MALVSLYLCVKSQNVRIEPIWLSIPTVKLLGAVYRESLKKKLPRTLINFVMVVINVAVVTLEVQFNILMWAHSKCRQIIPSVYVFLIGKILHNKYS